VKITKICIFGIFVKQFLAKVVQIEFCDDYLWLSIKSNQNIIFKLMSIKNFAKWPCSATHLKKIKNSEKIEFDENSNFDFFLSFLLL